MLNGLHEVVGKAGSNMNDASKDAILGLIDVQTSEQDGKPHYVNLEID